MRNWLRQFEFDKSLENPAEGGILLRPDIKDFKEFTGLPKYQAAMLAILCSMRKKTRWIKTLDYLQYASDQLPGHPVDVGFERLLIGKWIRTISDGTATGEESVRLTPDVEIALRKSQAWLLPKRPVKDANYPLRKLHAVAASVRLGNRSISDWVNLTKSIISRPRDPLTRLFGETDLKEDEVAITLFIAALSLYENVSIELTQVVSVFAPDPLESYDLVSRLSNPQHPLFTAGILVVESAWRGEKSFKPGAALVHAIHPSGLNVKTRAVHSALAERKCDSIPDVPLYFDEELTVQLEIVKQLCKPDLFSMYASTQVKTGQFPGMGVLLSGDPGTGKTEFCQQLARVTGRDLLVFDVAAARNKYYGDTEKSIKGIFDSYRKVVRSEKAFPILLFNEGDSIFQKRADDDNGVQQTENTIQTILLNELERFEGILLVTTNKPHFFDEAFDRRFLYKCRFGAPAMPTRLRLLQDAFPDLDLVIAEQLATDYVFTAAELNNFKKQQCIVELVFNQKQPVEIAIEQFLRQGSRQSSRKTIGFVSPPNLDNNLPLRAA